MLFRDVVMVAISVALVAVLLNLLSPLVSRPLVFLISGLPLLLGFGLSWYDHQRVRRAHSAEGRAIVRMMREKFEFERRISPAKRPRR